MRRALTFFGEVSLVIRSKTASGRIEAEADPPGRTEPAALLVRLGHPSGARMCSVRVNGREWTDFDPAKEWVRIPAPREMRYMIVANY